jgi:uncharacterized protein (DUF2062 family)
MAVSIQNLCNPPFVPFLCIEIGHWMMHGKWLTSIPEEVFWGQIPDFLWYWFLGSLVAAPILALIVGLGVYFLAQWLQEKRGKAVPIFVDSYSS